MMKQNNPLRRLLAALLAALTLVSFTILPVLGAAEDEAADTEAAETTEATAPKAEETEMEIISISTEDDLICLLNKSPSPRDTQVSRMAASA